MLLSRFPLFLCYLILPFLLLSSETGLPSLTFSRVVVRKTTASILEDLSSLFGEETEAFLSEEARSKFKFVPNLKNTANHINLSDGYERDDAEGKKQKEKRLKKIAGDWIAIAVSFFSSYPLLHVFAIALPSTLILW